MNETNKAERLLYLDSARGLAALSVLTWHFLLSVYGLDITGRHFTTPARLFWYGEADVIFFFIHSGFILAYTVTRRSPDLSIKSYVAYLLERIFRIYPLFLFILLLSAVLFWLLPTYSYVSSNDFNSHFWLSNVNYVDVLNQAILVKRIPESVNYRLIPQDWTLTVELLGGAAIPIMAYAGRKHLLIFVAILGVLKWTNWLSTYILEFGVGVLLFLYLEKFKVFWNKLPLFSSILIGLLALVAYSGCFLFPSLFTNGVTLVNTRIDRLIVVAGCILTFMILLSSNRLQRLLEYAPLVYIGKICFSIYLLHQLLIFIAWRLLTESMQSLQDQSVWLVMLVYLGFVGLVLLFSHWGYQLVEKPMIKVGKFFTGRKQILM